jgi:hypothetical protein
LEKLRQRNPKIFARTEYWLSRFGLYQHTQNSPASGHPQPFRLYQKLLALALLLVLLIGLATMARLGYIQLMRYWGGLQDSYRVVEVHDDSGGYRVELRRKWALQDRRYVLVCHLCEAVQVGSSYRFELVPGRRPPMMKRIAEPGAVPDYYTVLEGRVE